MASFLPDIVPSPFSKSFSKKRYILGDSPYAASTTNDSSTSLGTVRVNRPRKISSNSFLSASSAPIDPNIKNNENQDPQRNVSAPIVEHGTSSSSLRPPEKTSRAISHRSSWGTEIPVPPRPSTDGTSLCLSVSLEDVDLGLQHVSREPWSDREVPRRISGSVTHRSQTRDSLDQRPCLPHYWRLDEQDTAARSLDGHQNDRGSRPNRWMDTLRRKKRREQALTPNKHAGTMVDQDDYESFTTFNTFPIRRVKHSKNSSTTSSGFIGTVKTASFSVASLNFKPRSHRNSRASEARSHKRSSGLSTSNLRFSIDSDRQPTASSIDDAALHRGIKRRQVLEEILVSEESYVSDLKALAKVFSTLPTSTHSLSSQTWSSIQRNVMEILELHGNLVTQLHQKITVATETSKACSTTRRLGRHLQVKWHSLELLTEHKTDPQRALPSRTFGLFDPRGRPHQTVTADPWEAAQVALIFQRLMLRFFAYEEYCAKYETMVNDISSVHKSVPEWLTYDNGIEALAKSVIAIDTRGEDNNKGLTAADLVIKPIQRICKYPLLLADLLKNTPTDDCPSSHSDIDRVLQRFRELVQEVNMATDDPRARDRIRRTWSLQERLAFPDEISTPSLFRILGHAVLCGVLHVVYQSKSQVRGDYMVSVLFKTYLVLALPANDQGKFNVVATIHLADLKMESTEDGRGLQCHTALYSWKVVFQSDNHLFELIFSACSLVEEEQWKRHIMDRFAVVGREFLDDPTATRELFTTSSLDLQPAGELFGQAGTLARKLSIQRAATVGTRSNVCQVIIRNTHKQDIFQESQLPLSPSMNRSQSLLTTHRTAVLASKRSDRIRLEQALGDVWTRDLLPYPRMLVARSGSHIRASAGSLVRKLSLASLQGPFTRRSSSLRLGGMRRSNDTYADLRNNISEEEVATDNPGSGRVEAAEDVMINDGKSTFGGHSASSRRVSDSFKRLRRRRTQKFRRQSRTATEFPQEALYEKHVVSEERVEGKKRWSNPIGLLKNISAEGVRHLLYSSKGT